MMLKACATMAEATEKVDTSLEALKRDPYDDVAKDDLLWSARTVVQCTVTLLQLADNYDIRKIINGAKQSQKTQDDLLNLEDLSNDDIAEFYDRFTAVREQSYLERYGMMLNDSGKETVSDRYQQTAASG